MKKIHLLTTLLLPIMAWSELNEYQLSIDHNRSNLTHTQEEIIHGYTLPPEPDPDFNNATLAGIDSNNNGIRDDVERAIYKKYDKKLHAVFLMNIAKFYQRTLVESTENAKIIQKDSTKTIDCRIYLRSLDPSFKYVTFNKEDRYVKDLTLNNTHRIEKYFAYNKALSGGVYGSDIKNWAKHSCSQEVQNTLEEMGL